MSDTEIGRRLDVHATTVAWALADPARPGPASPDAEQSKLPMPVGPVPVEPVAVDGPVEPVVGAAVRLGLDGSSVAIPGPGTLSPTAESLPLALLRQRW